MRLHGELLVLLNYVNIHVGSKGHLLVLPLKTLLLLLPLQHGSIEAMDKAGFASSVCNCKKPGPPAAAAADAAATPVPLLHWKMVPACFVTKQPLHGLCCCYCFGCCCCLSCYSYCCCRNTWWPLTWWKCVQPPYTAAAT